MAMPDPLKFHGLNSFQFVKENINVKPPLSKKEAVFIQFLNSRFMKINLPIDNPKSML